MCTELTLLRTCTIESAFRWRIMLPVGPAAMPPLADGSAEGAVANEPRRVWPLLRAGRWRGLGLMLLPVLPIEPCGPWRALLGELLCRGVTRSTLPWSEQRAS